jgi:hypothetical protein
VALNNRLWIFFDAIFKRRSVVSVLASRFSRYVPLLDVMNRRPRCPERARTILVIGDRRHSAQALPKSRILFLRLCNYLSPFNAHIPPINRISSHSLTTLALVELASTATGRQVLHEVDTIISPSSTIQTNDGSYSSFFACCNKKDRLLPLDFVQPQARSGCLPQTWPQ